ncbi:MAG: MerR family transcriptional regulator [Pseudonocardiaceae bacterium]|nr:MerR family transcriptional regulator [Pseudonocardiaceae bacterium]
MRYVARRSEPWVHRAVREHGDSPTLPVAAVARRLGVAPATLRTWDRRYGLGPREHISGRHRRYGPADIARLEVMRRALLRGVSSAEAAHYALTSERAVPEMIPDPRDAGEPPGVESVVGELDRPAGGARLARGVFRAASAMDALALRQLLDHTIAERGVLRAWREIIEPAFGALSHDADSADRAPEVSHLFAECVLAAVLRATPAVSAPRQLRPVLLCCPTARRCGLPMYVVDAALCERSVSTQILGAALPVDVLVSAARRTQPCVVALWAQHPRHARPEVFDELAALRRVPTMLACGPGWTSSTMPADVDWLLEPDAVVRTIMDSCAAR